MSLIYYASQGNFAKVKEYLSMGADINEKNDEGETPLIAATNSGHLKVVNFLLTAGADPNIPDIYGNTALLMAIYTRREDIAFKLLEYNADPSLSTNEPYLIAATSHGMINLVEQLLKMNIDPNEKDINENTALIVATKNNDLRIVELLLRYQANPNIQDELGDTALIISCRNNNETIVKLLMDHNADPTIQNKKGDTALIIASFLGHSSIVELLLRYPKTISTIQITNKEGKSAFDVVKGSERKKILPLLVKARSTLRFESILTRDQFEKIKDSLDFVFQQKRHLSDESLRMIINHVLKYPLNEQRIEELFLVVDPTDYHTLNRLQSTYTQMLKSGETSVVTNIFYYAQNPTRPQELSISLNGAIGNDFVRPDFKDLLWVLYLIKRYNLSACYLMSVSPGLSTNKAVRKTNRKVQIIHDNFNYYRSEFSAHYSIAMFYDKSKDKFTFYIDPEIGPKINRCQERFVMIPVYLSLSEKSSAHAGLIVIDKIIHEVEIFDPHGYSPFAIFNKYIFDTIKANLDDSSMYNFYETLDYCPASSVQTIIELNLTEEFAEKYGYTGGFCQTWVPIYLHYRLMNQGVPRNEIIRYLVENPEVTTQLLVEYIRAINEIIPDTTDQVIAFVEEYNPTFSINLRRYADETLDVIEEDISPVRKKQTGPRKTLSLRSYSSDEDY